MTTTIRAASPPAAGAARAGRLGAWGALAALAAFVALAWTRTGHWGVAQDASNQLYVAWLMSRGAVLYRDVFEINWPGNFFLHRAIFAAFGDSDRTWWLLNAALAAGIAATVAALLRPAGALATALGVVLVAAVHVFAGPWNLVQRDQLVGAAVLLAALAARRGVAGAFVAGIVVGFFATVKPFAFAFLPALPLIAADGRGRAAFARAAAASGAGAALALALVFGRLWLLGGLDDFVATQRNFVLPFYGAADRREGATFVVRGLNFYSALALLLPFAASGLLARPAPALHATWRIAAAVIAYGIVHFAAQSKGFAYHSLPLIYGLVLAAGLGAGRAMHGRAGAWLLAVAIMLTAVVSSHVLQARTQLAYRSEVTQAIVDDLRPLLRAGDTVQPLDTVSGAINAMRLLRVAPPGRHIYDFPFFLGPPGDPFVTGLRRELIAALDSGRPRAIVITSEQWPAGIRGYERWSGWPELTAILDRDYRLEVERIVAEGWGYRIYLRRD